MLVLLLLLATTATTVSASPVRPPVNTPAVVGIKVNEWMDNFWDSIVIPSLSDFIRIPNLSPSFDPNWQTNGLLEQAANHLIDWTATINVTGMSVRLIDEPGKPPLVFIRISPFRNGRGNTLMYGHYDKQPPMDGWSDGLGPYTPVYTADGKLYGRGSADDGYSMYGSLAVFQYLQSQNIPHGQASIIIEGGEESGSTDLEYFLDLLADEIGNPNLIVCLDSGAGNYEQVFVTTSLRGGVIFTLDFDVVTSSVHSGSAGGMITDTFRAQRRLLNKIEDDETGEILLREFFVNIPDEREEQAELYADIMGTAVYDWIPFVAGVQPTTTDVYDLIIAKTWLPSLTITGADGLPTVQSASNVIRTNTNLRFSFRLPPTASSAACLAAVERVVASAARMYDDSAVVMRDVTTFNGWNAAPFANWLTNAVENASLNHFGKSALYTGEGGSIPFIGALQVRYPTAGFVVTGVLGPGSGAHGPNEFLEVNYVKSLTAVMVDIVVAAAQN